MYDFDANLHYFTGFLLDFWMHHFDTISGTDSFYKIQNASINLFYTGLTVEPGREIFKGFSCYKIRLVWQYGKLTLLATDQIGIPFYRPGSLSSA